MEFILQLRRLYIHHIKKKGKCKLKIFGKYQMSGHHNFMIAQNSKAADYNLSLSFIKTKL